MPPELAKIPGLVVSPDLDHPDFWAAWEMWSQHRKEAKKKLTPTTVKLQLKKLSGWGKDKAILAIETSIESSWQGLFEPKEVKKTPPSLPLPRGGAGIEIAVLPEMPKLTAAEQAANIGRIRQMIESSRALKSL
jgi:hypothetical protein